MGVYYVLLCLFSDLFFATEVLNICSAMFSVLILSWSDSCLFDCYICFLLLRELCEMHELL